MSPNNGMNTDLKKLALFQTGYPKRVEGIGIWKAK